MSKPLVCLVALSLVCGAAAADSFPKVYAAVSELISDKLGSDIIDQACQDVYTYVQNGTKFKHVSDAIYSRLEDQVSKLSAFYEPGLQLMADLSDFKAVLAKVGAEVKLTAKPYYVQHLLRDKPSSAADFDQVVAGFLSEQTVRNCMLNIEKRVGAADWNVILKDLWTPIRFDHNGFSQP